VVANWKMNMLGPETRDFAKRFHPRADWGVEVVLCPPHLQLALLRETLGENSPVRLGAQNLHPAERGAYTGEHSGAMIKDAGARYVIVGHSERRAMGEDDSLVRRKLLAAMGAGLCPILCVGENLQQRESGATLRVLRNQLSLALSGLGSPAPDPLELGLAYEPIWAIGTGRNATADQAQGALGFMRERLAELFGHAFARRVRLLYGGSAAPDNVAQLCDGPDVDGFLVGGASLDPQKFAEIARITGEVRAARLSEESEP
jgi:triosephosphate isomerase